MNFPRLVYKSAASFVPVESEEVHAEKLAEGWFDTVPEAIAGVSAKPELIEQALGSIETALYTDGSAATGTQPLPALSPAQQDSASNAPVTRDEMKAKAAELGLFVAHNISNIKLAELIEQALTKA